jgi:alkylation response protein AidB-like acyl-CoA dehydrogenase
VAGRRAWGEGDDTILVVEESPLDEELEALARARAWRALLDEHRLAWVRGPERFGGRGLSDAHALAVEEELDGQEHPDDRILSVGITIVGPAIAAHGSDRAVREVLGGIQRGEVMACQLFSEPGSGSDLASVSTRATRVDGGWSLTGQKVWTSGGHLANVGECLARTDLGLGKHAGLSMFLVDLHASGVTVRPLRQMTGGASFTEIFLDDVFVADDMLLGVVNGGWAVTMTTLLTERRAVGTGDATASGDALDRLLDLARHTGADRHPVTRDSLAALYIRERVNRWLVRTELDNNGGVPGPVLSASKLHFSRQTAEIADTAASILGMAVTADTGEWGHYTWSRYLTGAPGIRIAGGTDEIQRNTLAERVLGLPKERHEWREPS